jgi:hypothetical protein
MTPPATGWLVQRERAELVVTAEPNLFDGFVPMEWAALPD